MNKRFIAIVIAVVAVAIAAFVTVEYLSSLQKVIFVYDQTQGDVHLSGERIQGEMSITPNKEFSLQKGTYKIHISGDDAKSDTRTLNVQNIPITQTIPISLPDKKLQELLDKERSAISAIITKQYPQLSSLYTMRETLYNRGEWYGAVLTYKGTDTDNRDTLRLIAHKQAGQWKLITTPPKPLVSVAEYPSVPREVLDAINEPSYLPGTAISPAIYPN